MIKVTGADLCNAIDYRVERLRKALNSALDRGDHTVADQMLEQIKEAAESRKQVAGTIPSKILYEIEVKEGERLRDELV